MIDIEKIIQTGIPDIAPVYGGVRGRTMSSRHQSYAWPVIKEAGIKTIIDLREMDKSDKFPYTCKQMPFINIGLKMRAKNQCL